MPRYRALGVTNLSSRVVITDPVQLTHSPLTLKQMLPWGHAALGYVGYHLWLRLRHRLPPSSVAVLALGLGTQLPDLIDKPGTWLFGVLPSGRSLGHSLLTLGLATVVVVLLLNRTEGSNDRAWWALLGGWLAHLVGDAYWPLFDPSTCVQYLLWPLLSHCVYENDTSVLGWLVAFEFSPGQSVGLGFALLGAVLWWFDGRPGLQMLRKWGATRLSSE